MWKRAGLTTITRFNSKRRRNGNPSKSIMRSLHGGEVPLEKPQHRTVADRSRDRSVSLTSCPVAARELLTTKPNAVAAGSSEFLLRVQKPRIDKKKPGPRIVKDIEISNATSQTHLSASLPQDRTRWWRAANRRPLS